MLKTEGGSEREREGEGADGNRLTKKRRGERNERWLVIMED